MTEETAATPQEQIAQLTLEHMKYIRTVIDRMDGDFQDFKSRLTNLEEGQAGVHRRLDRMDTRLLTMEKRMGLVDV